MEPARTEPHEPRRLDGGRAVQGIALVEHHDSLPVDGQRVVMLEEGDTLHCTPAAESARFVRFGPRRFHQILKAKFGLADR